MLDFVYYLYCTYITFRVQHSRQNGENKTVDFMVDENVTYYATVKYSCTGGERLAMNENVAYRKCGQKALRLELDGQD